MSIYIYLIIYLIGKADKMSAAGTGVIGKSSDHRIIHHHHHNMIIASSSSYYDDHHHIMMISMPFHQHVLLYRSMSCLHLSTHPFMH
jgi:hypothetical protein